MPYIITTLHPWADQNEPARRARTRDAVATLDEARNAVAEMIPDEPTLDTVAEGVYDVIVESGGTVGPLPDGTVIEVQSVCWNWIIGVADDAGIDTDDVYEDGGDLAILAAFNGARA